MELSDGAWPDRLPAVEVRIARPTDKLGEVIDFYCSDLGLPELFRTTAHGYQVVMVGLPGDGYHLEFKPVELDNPWWRENGAIPFADPDNWRIVLMPKPIPLAS